MCGIPQLGLLLLKAMKQARRELDGQDEHHFIVCHLHKPGHVLCVHAYVDFFLSLQYVCQYEYRSAHLHSCSTVVQCGSTVSNQGHERKHAFNFRQLEFSSLEDRGQFWFFKVLYQKTLDEISGIVSPLYMRVHSMSSYTLVFRILLPRSGLWYIYFMTVCCWFDLDAMLCTFRHVHSCKLAKLCFTP